MYFQQALLQSFDKLLVECDREALMTFLSAQAAPVKAQLWRLIEQRLEELIDRVTDPLDSDTSDTLAAYKSQLVMLLGEGFTSRLVREEIFNQAVIEGQDWLIETISAVYARNNQTLPAVRQGALYA